MTTDKSYILLDGGMGRELERMGAPFKQPEWSALALMEAPECVIEAHVNFINAGAQIITTNSYALVPYHIGEDFFWEKGANLIKMSAVLATRAKEKTEKPVRIAGCIPPLFGSYMPELFTKDKAEEILSLLINEQDPYIDFWLIETVSSIEEALCVYELIKKYSDKPIWLSYSLVGKANGKTIPSLRSLEKLEEGIKALLNLDAPPDAILFNCCQPEEISPALKLTNKMMNKSKYPDIKTGAYANSFVKAKKRRLFANKGLSELRAEMTPDKYLTFAKDWRKNGASIIGGCCGIGPEHIKTLAEHLK